MRKKTRRKVYALMNPISMAIEGAQVTADDKLEPIRNIEKGAIANIAGGFGTLQSLSYIRDMLNIAEVMARAGMGIEVLEPSLRAQAILIEAVERMNETGVVSMSESDIAVMNDVYEWHDLQRISVSQSEYERFIVKTANLAKTGQKNVTQVFIR